MGKAAILIIVSSIAFGSMYAFGAKEDAKQAEERLALHQYEVLARNAAVAGYELAKQALAEDFSGAPSTYVGDYQEAQYVVTVIRNGSRARIISIGSITTGNGTVVDYTVDTVIEEIPIVDVAEEAPAFMKYALIAEDDLEIKGNVEMETYLKVEGNEENTLNANMHTNGSLTVNGNAATVRGFGTYVNYASGKLENTFDPYYNPADDPVVSKVDPIEIPTFDIPTMLSRVQEDQTSTGDVSLSGTVDYLGGTRDDPYVWYIQGDLKSTGNVQIDGYVMFIVDGNVSFGGSFTAGPTGYDGADESSLAIYARGTVGMGGNSEFYGQIYSGTGISFMKGTPRLYGSLATTGGVTLNGTPNIYYREPSPALTTVFEEPEYDHVLASYAEY